MKENVQLELHIIFAHTNFILWLQFSTQHNEMIVIIASIIHVVQSTTIVMQA